MARALILDPPALERLAEVKAYAEANPLNVREMLRAVQGKRPPIGDDPRHRVLLRVGFRAVFSIEDHGKVVVRHLSVSVNDSSTKPPTKAPNLKAVAMIARELGFTIGEDLEFRAQLIQESPTFGLLVPNVFERISDG